MGDVVREVVQSAPEEMSEEAQAQALAAAASTAPTTQEEAQAQIDAAKVAEAPAAERPAWLPEKFTSAEDMAKAYAELEAKMGKPPEAEAPKATEEKPVGEAEGEPKKASEVVASLNERFTANGALNDEDYALAESIGHDRATVDAFVAGQKALAEEATRRITDAAGGKETLDRVFAWASTTLKPDEIDTFNKSFEGNDVNAAVIAMEQLKGRYESVNGRDPKLVSGKPPSTSNDVFDSWAQVSAAMSDPRYSKDPAYRAQVETKVARSTPR